MLKNLFIVTKHSYWEHFGSQSNKNVFDSEAEAKAAAAEYENSFFMEDGYYATVHKEKKLVITPEEEEKRAARKAARKTFNYRKDSYAYGVYTFWDGSKDVFYIELKEEGKYIHFLKTKEVWKLASHLDYFRNELRGKWVVGPNEKMTILGGIIKKFPEMCQNIDAVELKISTEILNAKYVVGENYFLN